ncbi:HAMP domain-containing protein [Exiguobacterium sp. SH5S4]|uniref:HAMP domain-containing sensor histidine kinase n=1 Tax=Exiguobacterium sp. SH5S4 TaxID=2510961 RepID=UPI001040D3F5|nr:HAMP domain-containing sensor histidine kinase [Exiguobacterium sp. SH5S4]TCI25780.1 HAMP domain-containing protein [Exiguobacterium sp. SH5S4]
MKAWIDERIGRQFLFVFYLFIGLILLTSLAVYVYTENRIEETTSSLENVSERRTNATELFETWQSMQYEMRGYVLLGDEELLVRVKEKQVLIETQTAWFETNAVTEKEQTYAGDARALFSAYQQRVMPSLERYVVAKREGTVTEPFLQMPTLGKVTPQTEAQADRKFKINSKSAADMSASIVDMETVFTEYRNALNAEENQLREQLATHTKWAQVLWLLSLLTVLLVLFIAARPYVQRLTGQLQELITNSKRLTDDRVIPVPVLVSTRNEVGQLTDSFRQMASSLSSQRYQVEEEREKTARLLHSIRDAVIYVEHTTHEKLANQALFVMFNQAITKQNETDLYRLDADLEELGLQVDQKDSFFSFMRRAFDGEAMEESVTFSMNQEERFIQMYAEKIHLRGTRHGTMLVFRDVTQETEVDRLKTELVSTVSHELRTPLTSIIGFTELMRYRTMPAERTDQYLGMIHQETLRLEDLISNLLDVQRMESGKQTYQNEPESLYDILAETIAVHQGASQHHYLSFECDTDVLVYGDRNRLSQLFTNLLHNAIKYSPNGGKVAVSVTNDQSDGVEISVTDSGIGIPTSALPKLFDKFYRVDNSASRKIGGTGLGLAICKEIVEGHDGTIRVDSRVGLGSTFTIVLPKYIEEDQMSG